MPLGAYARPGRGRPAARGLRGPGGRQRARARRARRGRSPRRSGRALADDLLARGARELLPHDGSAHGGPLAGRRILVTRRPEPVVARSCARSATGAPRSSSCPAIEIGPARGPAAARRRACARSTATTGSSSRAPTRCARCAIAWARSACLPSRSGGPRIASVGPATTEAVRARFPAERSALEPAGDVPRGRPRRGVRPRSAAPASGSCFPLSDRARDELALGLRELGAEVDVVVAYRTVAPPDLGRASVGRCLDQGFDAVTFASPSAVEGFAGAAGREGPGAGRRPSSARRPRPRPAPPASTCGPSPIPRPPRASWRALVRLFEPLPTAFP